MNKIGDVLFAISKSFKQRGIAGTIGRCFAEPLYRFHDWRFDRKFQVETSGIIPAENLDIRDADRKTAVHYEPVRLHAFAEVMRILPIRQEEFAFVDFGSGKGRVLLLASEFPFRKIVGIEISPMLCQIAAKNIEAYRNTSQKCKDIGVICQNAAIYSISPDPAVFYFYNPFDESVFASILENLRQSLAFHPRKMLLVLYNPVLDHVVRQAPFLRMVKTTGRCSIYESNATSVI